MISAPLASSGFAAGSSLTKNWRPAASFSWSPGVTPSVLPPMTAQGPASGPANVFGPRTTSAIVRPRRLRNQLESRTSPTEFRSIAADAAPARLRKASLNASRTGRPLVGRGEAVYGSESTSTGSSGENRGVPAHGRVPKASTRPTIARTTPECR